jgi:hypothetical protein
MHLLFNLLILKKLKISLKIYLDVHPKILCLHIDFTKKDIVIYVKKAILGALK